MIPEETKNKAMELIGMGVSLQKAADTVGVSKAQVGKWKMQVFGRCPDYDRNRTPSRRKLEGYNP